MTPRVLFKKLRPDAVVPKYMSPGAAGLDLTAALDEPVEIPPQQRRMISTGLAIEIPFGYEGSIRPRSGLARDHGISLVNSPGTLDSDFRGTVQILVINHGEEPFVVERGLRIAQLVIAPVAHAEIEEVAELTDTERGAGGFGSTGR